MIVSSLSILSPQSRLRRHLASIGIRLVYPTSKEISEQIIAHVKTLAQKDVGNWLRRFFNEAGSAFAGLHEDSYFLVSSTNPVLSKGPRPLEIVITKDLGDGERPNKKWNANLHF
ncbi:hypothetical protein NUU61_009118 [Penicillium alfredii]|uniref:Uncharacterized protein n=1 Tax=Penicillium alfredii TaxID=1506179 RepID=A0A9W9JWL8_9EURO|nr:uncharacterized protein NUU61_009118 [Penicillium alfredii]KAJ5084539.1 hypothetical protein NUU61_009118 [Penicillium alfredii]